MARTVVENTTIPIVSESGSLRKSQQHYSCGLYAAKLLKNLNTLRKNGKFCDVELEAGGKVLQAHRAVLSSSSPYFQAMFTGGLVEEKLARVPIRILDSEILEGLVNFIYTGEIHVDQFNVQELLIASDMLELDEVVSACSDFLKKELHPSNCLGIYRFAEDHHCKTLSMAAQAHIHHYFTQVTTQEEFPELPKEYLIPLLCSEKLKVDCEYQVFTAGMNWILHNVVKRRRYVFEILSNVRLPLIHSKHLDNYVENCHDVSLKVALKSIQKDVVSHRGTLVPLSVQPRQCARKTIYVIGGSKRELISSWTRSECTFESVVFYDTFKKEWGSVAPMGIGRILPGVAVLDGKIYVVGGEQESQILANGEVYDPLEDKWSQMAVMVIPRCEFGMCAFDGCLYAFGGWIGEDIGSVIERYDPRENKWTLIDEMPQARFSMGVIAYQGLIYMVGGCTRSRRHLQEVICYNPVTKKFNYLSSMLVPRSQMGVTVLNDYLYVVGGINRQNQVLKSVERYSFNEDKWTEIPPMTVGRASPAVATANNLMYVIGGDQIHGVNAFYRAQVTLSVNECFDPQTNTWDTCASLPESRSEAAAAVI